MRSLDFEQTIREADKYINIYSLVDGDVKSQF
jgi:hypothetical protein